MINVGNNDTEGLGSKIYLGFQAPWNFSYPFSAQRLGAAIELAIDKIYKEWDMEQLGMGNKTFEVVYSDSGCSAKTALPAFIDQFKNHHISAIFGPVCPEAAEVGGTFSRAGNRQLLTSM